MAWIRDLGSGHYQAIYRDGKGRQRSKTFPRKKDARAWLAAQEVTLATGQWIDPRAGQVPFSTLVHRWQLGRSVERSTDASDTGRITNHLIPAFGDWAVGSIRYLDVQAWMRRLDDKGLSPKTRRECLSLLRMILDAAVAEGTIPANPAASVKAPPKVNPVKRKVSRAEVDAVLAEATAAVKARVGLGAFTGVRWGEACGLRYANVDLAHRTIAIVETMEEINGHFHRKHYPKDREARVVPIADELAEILLDHMAARLLVGRPADTDLVFPSRRGTPVYRSNNDRALERACVKAGVRPFNFKDLRAFCASYLINDRGVPVTVVRELLGHSRASMTLEVYTDTPTGWHDTVRQAFTRS